MVTRVASTTAVDETSTGVTVGIEPMPEIFRHKTDAAATARIAVVVRREGQPVTIVTTDNDPMRAGSLTSIAALFAQWHGANVAPPIWPACEWCTEPQCPNPQAHADLEMALRALAGNTLTQTGDQVSTHIGAVQIVLSCCRPGHAYRVSVRYGSTGAEIGELSASWAREDDARAAARSRYRVFAAGRTVDSVLREMAGARS